MCAPAGRVLKPMVYVIEDDPDHQKIAEMTLQSAGIENIIFFSTGEEAMDFFSDSDPPGTAEERVILIDLMLPNIGGLEILQKLREDSPPPEEEDWLGRGEPPFEDKAWKPNTPRPSNPSSKI